MSVLRKVTYHCLIVSLLAGTILFLTAQQTPSSSSIREYQVKAVFLFNFSQFVEWPTTVFASPQTPLVIGVLGENPFGSYLDETVSGEKVNDHPLVVQRYRTIEDAHACQILFISAADAAKMGPIMTSLKGKNILTVSDASNFIQEGGMIRFFTANNKIHFQINPDAAKKAGLTISSKLLKLAEIVVPKKK